MKTVSRTLYVPVEYQELFDKFPNAGPNPNIIGMKQIWGKGSYCIKCGNYLYKVDRETYYHYAELF